MKHLIVALVAVGVAVTPALYAKSKPAPPVAPAADPTSSTHLEAARTAELRGDHERSQHNFDGAINFYLDSLKVGGQNAMVYNKLGISELQIGSRAQARRYFNMALKADSRNTVAFNNLGAVACTDGKYKLAVKYLKQALALDESDATAHLNIAEAWAGMGEMDRAMNEYSRALELDADVLNNAVSGVVAQVHSPQQRARISFLIAKAYAKRGNIDGAFEYLRRAKEDQYAGLSKVYEEPEFASLLQDPRLSKIVKR